MKEEQVKMIVDKVVSAFEKVLKLQNVEAVKEAKKIPTKVFKRCNFWTPIGEEMSVSQIMVQFNDDFHVIANISNGNVGYIEFHYKEKVVSLSSKEENAMKWFVDKVIWV